MTCLGQTNSQCETISEQILQLTLMSNNNKTNDKTNRKRTEKNIIHFSKQNNILPCLHLMHCQREQMQSHVICRWLDQFWDCIPARFHIWRNNPLYPLKHKMILYTVYLFHVPHTINTVVSYSFFRTKLTHYHNSFLIQHSYKSVDKIFTKQTHKKNK